MSWYYAEGQAVSGPISESELVDQLFKGNVNGETLVWKEGMPDWQPLVETELIRGTLLSNDAGEVADEDRSDEVGSRAEAETPEASGFDPRSGLEEELESVDPEFRHAAASVADGSAASGRASAVTNEYQGQIDGYMGTFSNGANWFYWIAALTIINIVLIAVGSPIILAFGMAVPELGMYLAFDWDTGELDRTLMWSGIALGVILSAVCAAIGWFSNQGNKMIFGVGIALIALDTLLFIFPLFSIIALVVHGYALWAMVNGIFALIKLQRLEGELAAVTPAGPENA